MLDHDMWGIDQKASLTVAVMAIPQGRMKDVLAMLGTGEKRLRRIKGKSGES